MKQTLPFFIILLFTISQSSYGQNKGDKVFDPSILHVVKITSQTQIDLYEAIQMDGFSAGPFGDTPPYYMINMEFDGEEIDSIGIRSKGLSSNFNTEQAPMKIDVNEYIDDRTFDGIKKFGFTNSYADPYRQKDRIAYELFRRSGIASPHTSYAEVYIDDDFIGIYLLVEQINKDFIKQSFSDSGSLRKLYEVKYGDDTFFGATTTLANSKFDIRNYFKFVLINELIDANDNFPVNNFYTYYSDKEEIYHHLPWDYNLCMDFSDPDFKFSSVYSSDEIWVNPEMKLSYLEVACELYNYLLDDDYIEELINSNQSIILSNTQGATVDDASNLITYINDRRIQLGEELQLEGYNCGDFSYPHQTGDLVINEFVAKSDSIGGVQEPDGGTPDWIELYNNTDEDIVLNHHYYLSDDIHFPKKWNFQEPITIPANGYQIIWADRDVHQQGVHSNFKIEKSGGDLMLVYEDMTIIDQVSYEEQELNKGYARVPNGTGDFVIQNHTFNGDNDVMTSTNFISQSNIVLYPNPTVDRINITNSDFIDDLSIHSSTGHLLKNLTVISGQIDLSDIPPGMYILFIQSGGRKLARKIVKM